MERDRPIKPYAWPVASPQDAGFRERPLEKTLDYCATHDTAGVVIVHDGRIIAERYGPDFDARARRRLYSAGKSIVAVLVGMAIDDGAIAGVDAPAADHAPEWRGKDKEAITIRHLLSMTSGLTCTFDIDFRQLPARPDVLEYVLRLTRKHPPGEAWAYNNAAYFALVGLLERAVARPLDAFARERLFAPLGMADTHWSVRETPAARNLVSIHASCRDAARFGQFVLDGGMVDGKPLVSPAFLDAMRRPSSDMNPAYGWLWWLNGSARHRLPNYLRADEHDGPLIPNAPADMFAAMGMRDQKVYIAPSQRMVVARLGGQASRGRPLASGSFDRTFWRHFGPVLPG